MSDEIAKPAFPEVPKLGLAPVAPAGVSPTGLAVIGQTLMRIMLAVKPIALAVGAVFTAFLPQPWAVVGVSVSGGVYAIADAIVGASPGVRKVEKDVTPPKV